MSETKRVVVPEAEAYLGKSIPVLDHGSIRLVDYMGSDAEIVNAARVSYGRGTKSVSDDRSLIRYLMRYRHTSPFEMVEAKWQVEMPIFVARQWMRHRTANVNEVSYRYSHPELEFYFPLEWRAQSGANKQGSSEESVDRYVQDLATEWLRSQVDAGVNGYESLVGEGISKELVRIGLPVNLYTRLIWKNDLRNTLHFLELRKDSHAQKEIREYANIMGDIVKAWLPLTWEAFEDYVLNAVHFSAEDQRAIRAINDGVPFEHVAKTYFSSKTEGLEFLDKYKKLFS